MTATKADRTLKAKRCAVCKIDLKGRFVYVDDTTERLTGYTKEELFGKRFLDLVSESGHELVSHVLYHRSHCETFFDSIQLEIVDREKKQIRATVIFSLNFIAGNPVNFQIIIDAETESDAAANRQKEYPLRDFQHELLVLSPATYGSESLSVLAEYLSHSHTIIYRYAGAQLTVVSSAGSSKTGGLVSADPEPTRLLLRVAETGEEYSCGDSEQVQRSIEQTGLAPHEYIALLDLGEEHQYLVRSLFEEHTNAGELQFRIGDIRQAIQLVSRLRPSLGKPTPSEAAAHVDAARQAAERERTMLQEAQLALANATQILNRLDKVIRV